LTHGGAAYPSGAAHVTSMMVVVVAAAVVVMVVAIAPSVHDAAMILTRLGAGLVVVGQGGRGGGGEEGRTDGGDQETLHSLFLGSEVTRTFGEGLPAVCGKVTAQGEDATKR
jgi:hypothetical protein